MKNIKELKAAVTAKSADKTFLELYGEKKEARCRYLKLIERFERKFPDVQSAGIFSTPGRTEIGGNHTDHNGGHILAGSVNLDVVSVAAPCKDRIIIYSEGYPPIEIFLDKLDRMPTERGTSTALVKGVCSRFMQLGYITGGFFAVTDSTVLPGSGLSSSAAFEIQIANILNHLYNSGKIEPITLAKIAQYAENVYFGKPCGLMDMSVCAIGGLTMIDFKKFDEPVIESVPYDFSVCGYDLLIIDTGGNHADMTDDYTELEHEMKAVAQALGGHILREFSKDQVIEKLQYLRTKVSDRAILRALHFFDDDKRVLCQRRALYEDDFDKFLYLIKESGRSSWELCQNCYSHKYVQNQGISIALEMSKLFLNGNGAYRVHGGGFAGTIQVFVPNEMKTDFIYNMRRVLGEVDIYSVKIRASGTISIEI